MQNIIYSIVESMVNRELPLMSNIMVPEGSLDTTTALIYDSVNAFALALNELTSVQQVYQTTVDCKEDLTWIHGNSLMNYMKVIWNTKIMMPHRNFNYLDGWVYWTDRTNQIWYLRYIVGNIFYSILSLEAYWQHMFNICWNLNINYLRPENPIHPWPDGAPAEWFGEGRDFIVLHFTCSSNLVLWYNFCIGWNME